MTFYIESLGCAKNQVDSELLAAALGGREALAHAPDGADCLIVNSCGFIESAKQESINAVLELRRRFPEKKIVLAGCLARRYGRELRESLCEADAVIASVSPAEIAGEIRVEIAPDAAAPQNAAGMRPLLSPPGSAFLKIAEGCDNRCSFCAIPTIRGPLVSRSISEITAEFHALLERGIFEINLIAQDTAAFGFDTAGKPLLAELLEALSAERGAFWARLLYLHPDHFPLDILDVMRRDERILPYFDIPFQHASSKILKLMGRRGDGALYLALIAQIRRELPRAVLRSTFLTGFPGESEADFDELLAFQHSARLDWAGVFAYSREDGTAAWNFKNRPQERTTQRRKTALEAAQTPLSEARLERFMGSELDVLVEAALDGEAGAYRGRSYACAPEVDGAVILRGATSLEAGSVVRAKVSGVEGFNLIAGILR